VVSVSRICLFKKKYDLIFHYLKKKRKKEKERKKKKNKNKKKK
jgi:hypothetical protein